MKIVNNIGSYHTSTLLFVSLVLSFGCGEDGPSDESAAGESNTTITTISDGPEIAAEETCDQEYSVCGYIRIPFNFEGTPTSLAVGLYAEPTPAGSPDIVLTQIAAPSVTPGELYPIRVHPFLDTGDYHLWVFIYVEGGGTNRPINGVDYMGTLTVPMTFDGQALEFETVDIEPASGW